MNNKLHDLQKFTVKRLHRSKIKQALYNPRTISKENKNLLWKNLQKKGLLETLAWNETTGNLVSGHRRLEKLDDYHQKKYGNLDYSIDVVVLNLSEKEEKEQNIFFNNPNAQGEWDRSLMLEMIDDIDLKEAGFTDTDLSAIGIELDLQKHQDEEVENIIEEYEEIKQEQKEQKKIEREMNPEQKDWKQVKKDIKQQQEAKSDVKEDYVVLSFDSFEHKKKFMKRFGFNEDDRYIKGEILEGLINDIRE